MRKTVDRLRWAVRHYKPILVTGGLIGAFSLGAASQQCEGTQTLRTSAEASKSGAAEKHPGASKGLGGLACTGLTVEHEGNWQVVHVKIHGGPMPNKAQVVYDYTGTDGDPTHGIGSPGETSAAIVGRRHGDAQSVTAKITLGNAAVACPHWQAPSAAISTK